MSYLRKLTDKGAKSVRILGFKIDGHAFGVTWRSTTGTIIITPQNNVYYARYSKLGMILRSDHEAQRHYIGKAVCEALSRDGSNDNLQWVGV